MANVVLAVNLFFVNQYSRDLLKDAQCTVKIPWAITASQLGQFLEFKRMIIEKLKNE